MNSKSEETHFGKKLTSHEDQMESVQGVFTSVSEKYDLMNDLMSLGLHRLWKKYLVNIMDVESGQKILDLAAGTCDVTALLSNLNLDKLTLFSLDRNESMLSLGRDKLINSGKYGRNFFLGGSAEKLPFRTSSLDRVVVAFGMRNFSSRSTALDEVYRVLKPGGKMLSLEFSHLKSPYLDKIYSAYLRTSLPLIGKIITGDASSYAYLADSIETFPEQKEVLKMMQKAGFVMARCNNIFSGLVAIHSGVKS